MFKVDNQAQILLEAELKMFGVRALLKALAAATDAMAMAAGDNFNTREAKQWAAWSVAIEALADNRKLLDPGR